MTRELHRCLLRQLETAWKLADYHLDELTTEECLWRPGERGLHVHEIGKGIWRADWPDRETYDIGPPSIAWTTWHMAFWWSMVLDHSFGNATLTREDVLWPGDAGAAREQLVQLQRQWQTAFDKLTDADLQSPQRTRWPFQNRAFSDVVAWVNIELTKNAAEIGYARFLYSVRPSRTS